MVDRRHLLLLACLSIALPATGARAADLAVSNNNIFRVNGPASASVNTYDNVSVTTGGSILVQIVQFRTSDSYNLPVVKDADQGALVINGNLTLNSGALSVASGFHTANYGTDPEDKDIADISPKGASLTFKSATAAVSMTSATLSVDGTLGGSPASHAPTLSMDDSALSVSGKATFKTINASNSTIDIGAGRFTFDRNGSIAETYGVYGGSLTATQVDLTHTDLNIQVGTFKITEGLTIDSGSVSLAGGILDATGKNIALTGVDFTSVAAAEPYSNPFNAGGFTPAPTIAGTDGNVFVFRSTIKGAAFALADTAMGLAYTDMTATGAVRVGILYDMVRKNPDLTATLPNTASYPIETDALKPFGVEADAELGFRIASRVDLSARYTGQWRSSYENHSGQITLKVRF
ncbi:MAG: hypothetical protein PHX68_01185 [Alphaproteobacteria bacterium]|nr:hypothetical protein [Alphaproteobacteria bacterium]